MDEAQWIDSHFRYGSIAVIVAFSGRQRDCARLKYALGLHSFLTVNYEYEDWNAYGQRSFSLYSMRHFLMLFQLPKLACDVNEVAWSCVRSTSWSGRSSSFCYFVVFKQPLDLASSQIRSHFVSVPTNPPKYSVIHIYLAERMPVLNEAKPGKSLKASHNVYYKKEASPRLDMFSPC